MRRDEAVGSWYRWSLCLLLGWAVTGRSVSAGDGDTLDLSPVQRARCTEILLIGLASDEFWPSMHAAEALSQVGLGDVVRAKLSPRLPQESDDQRRCGLARELVRAGDLSAVGVLLDILGKDDAYGHTHACESLFKVWQIGDGRLLRAALARREQPKTMLMAAAALARWGNPEALALIREYVAHEDQELGRIAAWILARTGNADDWPALRAGVERAEEPLTRAYFEHALAALGDSAGAAALVRNLRDAEGAIRVYACEFAPEARAVTARPDLLALLEDEVLDVRIRAAQALLLLAAPAPASDGPIAVDVFVANNEHPRYSEGSVAVLQDGRLLYATTEFMGSGSDFATARIVAVESADGGRTWSEPRVLQENVGKQNVMSVTLRRLTPSALPGAPLGCFYLVKNSPSDLDVYLKISTDEGRTFGEPLLVTDAPGYHVLNNDRITVLSSGRIIVPVASTEDVSTVNHFQCSCFYSDDQGRTWRRSRNQVDYAKRGAMEPEVLELAEDQLLMHFRTQLGHIAVSESHDSGVTWSTPKSWNVRAPEAPATLRRIPATGDLVLIWNDNYVAGKGHGGKRTPLTVAVSRDAGRTWTHQQNLETSQEHQFAYTSVTFDRGRMLLTYYVAEDSTGRISSRFRSLPIRDLYR